MSTFNDVEFNEHCMRLRQIAEELPMLMREGKRGLLWVKLDQARVHVKDGIDRLLEIDKEPVLIDINADKRQT